MFVRFFTALLNIHHDGSISQEGSSAEKVEPLYGTSDKERPELRRFTKALFRMDGYERMLLLAMASEWQVASG
jgi:hypothetical protein